MLQKHSFHTVKAIILRCKSYAFTTDYLVWYFLILCLPLIINILHKMKNPCDF